MTQTQEIFDFYHRKIGSIETDTATGNKKALDFYRRVLGFYDKKLDVTMDFYRRVLGHGDFLVSLIMQEAQNK